ncbi:25390_t:CDS:2, partial [Gigaspora margarita]
KNNKNLDSEDKNDNTQNRKRTRTNHKLATIIYNKNQTSLIHRITKQLSEQKLKIISLMRNIYYLTKCEQALNQYPALCQLGNLQFKNLNELCYEAEPQVLKLNLLFSDNITLKWTYSSYKNLSLMIDKSTLFTAKHLAIVSKYISKNNSVLYYLGLVELDDCSAEAIMEDLKRFITTKSIDINNLIHFGSDSASTMLEKQTGIATRLKKINLYITENHCIAHHLHLACKDVTKEVQYFQKYEKIVKGIYLYFSSSYKRLLALKLVQNNLNEPELVLLNIISTRWLFFSNVIHNFYQSLESVKGALLDKASNNFQALELLSSIDEEFELATMFLADLFFILSKLICIFQSDYVSFLDIQCNIDITIQAIQVQFIGNNQILPTYGQISLEYIKNNNINILLSFVSEFSLAIIKNLEKRFPNRELYYAMRIFDPQELPESDNNLANYENIEINILGDFYGNDKIIGKKKFTTLLNKRVLFFLKNYHSLKFTDAWHFIFSRTSFISDYFTISTLVHICLIVPISNANVERVFSQQKLIKSRLQNQMTIQTLNDHLMVVLNGPPIQLFNFEKAFEYWFLKE